MKYRDKKRLTDLEQTKKQGTESEVDIIYKMGEDPHKLIKKYLKENPDYDGIFICFPEKEKDEPE